MNMPTAGKETRTLLLESELARVELLHASGLSRRRTPPVHSPHYQLLLPLDGVFNWHLGASTTLLNANQVLFIVAGDVSQDSHPSNGDAGCLLLTPSVALLETLLECDAAQLAARPMIARRVIAADGRIQRIAASLFVRSRSGLLDAADIEEMAIHLLSLALESSVHVRNTPANGDGSKRLVDAVKEFVSTCEGRISLNELATRFDVSPAYLTDTFRRNEGMPLGRYHRQLRLARALVELPHAEDITELALRLGFSSHAHFSSLFRTAFQQTPSEYRRSAR